MSDWISVDDRLPDDMQIVLIVYGGYVFSSGHLYSEADGSFRGLNGRYTPTDMITHWMPIPEPPTE